MEQDDHDSTTAISPIVGGEISTRRQPALIVMSGPTAGQTVLLENRPLWKLGRSTESDIVLQDASVSRSHAQIQKQPKDLWELVDLNSSNGTFVNGEKIDRRVLKPDDKIQFGSNTIVKFVMQDDSEAALQSELYESATKDSLTQLYSKRYFVEHLDVEFNFHRRTKKPLSLVMADIDFFKKINDSFGHLAGDYVLKETGRIIMNVLRKGDIAGRYGGEEIVFLLRETPLPGARIFAERLRELVAHHHFFYEGKKIQVTLSLGIATATQGNFNKPEELIAQADEFLYQAKKAGRNRSMCLIDSQ